MSTEKDVNEIEVVDAEIVSGECTGALCHPENYFEQLEKCTQCNRII